MHLLRYFSLILLIAIGTKFENALATYYAVGGSGQFVWSTSVYPFIYGICASGDDVACGSETNIHSTSPNEVGFSKNAVSYVVSGYQVSTYVLMQCADSDFMCANCGSHSDKNCQYNGYAGISGIACCTPSYPIFMQKGTGVNYAQVMTPIVALDMLHLVIVLLEKVMTVGVAQISFAAVDLSIVCRARFMVRGFLSRRDHQKGKRSPL